MHIDLSLRAQYDTISVESMSGESSLKQALTRLPGYFKDVGKSLHSTFKLPFSLLFPSKDLAWAAQVVEKKPYIELRKESFPCIPGIQVDYLTYINALHESAVFCTAIRADYIEVLIEYLAKKLSSPRALSSLQPDDSLASIRIEPIERLNKLFIGMIDPKKGVTEQPYSKLFKRHADWKDLVVQAQVIHRAFSQDDHVRLESSVKRCDELLSLLVKRISESKDALEMSAVMLDRIAKAAYIVAAAVELYGLTYRRSLILDHALDNLVDKVATL